MNNPKVLIITPIEHIKGLRNKIEEFSSITYMPNEKVRDVQEAIPKHDAIFTNPNKSNVFLGKEVLDPKGKLKVICTASTGTNHIDTKYAIENDITILSLTEERDVINKISSTAEHALSPTLAALRKIPQAFESVRAKKWDYEPFVGRQFDHLTVGVIGYGRLGRYYSQYAQCFGAKVMVYDPYKLVDEAGIEQVEEVSDLLEKTDIISLHVHATDETKGLVDACWFKRMKSEVLLVNTSRGEIVNEMDLLDFLKNNEKSLYATDVIANEIRNKKNNPLIEYALNSEQVLITPHIGGMTEEGQYIAYNHAADLLKAFFKERKAKN